MLLTTKKNLSGHSCVHSLSLFSLPPSPCGASVTAVACQVMLKCLEAIWHRRLGLIIQNMLLLHNNTRPHIDHAIFDLLGIWCWEYDPHSSYGPELSLQSSPHWADFKNIFEVSVFHLTTPSNSWSWSGSKSRMFASTTRNVVICYDWCLNNFAVLKQRAVVQT